MAQPIFFDDGGSTRIKLFNGGVGDLGGLLDVDNSKVPPKASHPVNGPYRNVKIVWIDQNGTATKQLDTAVNAGDSLIITSQNGQSVTVDLTPAGKCVITVLGSGAVAPLVEAKQFSGQRRYVVANAGPIQKVDSTIGGVAASFDAVAAGSVYTTVVLNQ